MTDPADRTSTRWAQLSGGSSGEFYAARFAALAASGKDLDGEARFCAALVPAPARVLDAGCGTGRIAIALAGWGYQVLGVDLDESMLAQARLAAPQLDWVRGDLATFDLAALNPANPANPGRPVGNADPFDLVVVAGNVVPLLAEGSLSRTLAGLAATLVPVGYLVTGFGLDAAHLPAGCPVTPLPDYDRAVADAGLGPAQRYSTWQGGSYPGAGGYCVNVHRKGS